MNEDILMKLVTINYHQVQIILVTLRMSVVHGDQPVTTNRSVNAAVPEPMKGFQPNLTQIFPPVSNHKPITF